MIQEPYRLRFVAHRQYTGPWLLPLSHTDRSSRNDGCPRRPQLSPCKSRICAFLCIFPCPRTLEQTISGLYHHVIPCIALGLFYSRPRRKGSRVTSEQCSNILKKLLRYYHSSPNLNAVFDKASLSNEGRSFFLVAGNMSCSKGISMTESSRYGRSITLKSRQ